MSDIAIGSVVIQDVNQNNLFDAGVDGVVDPSGQPFSPSGRPPSFIKSRKN